MLGGRDVKVAMDFYTSTLGFACPSGAMEAVPGEGAVYAIVSPRL